MNNNIFKIIFNKSLGKMDVVSEHAHAEGKASSESSSKKLHSHHKIQLGLSLLFGLMAYQSAWGAIAAYTQNGQPMAVLCTGGGCSIQLTEPTYILAQAYGTGDGFTTAGTSFQTSDANSQVISINNGASFQSTGNLAMQSTGAGTMAIYAQNAKTLVQLADTTINSTGDNVNGVVSINVGANLTASGKTSIITSGNNSAAIQVFGRANDGVTNSTISLNNLQVNATGGASPAIEAVEFGQINVSGYTNVTTTGTYSDGVLALNGAKVSMTGGGTVAVEGANSAAIRLASSPTVSDNLPSAIAPDANQVSLTGFTLQSTQGNIIEVNGGNANGGNVISLTNTTAKAMSGKVLLNVDNGSSSPVSAAKLITSSPAQLTFNSNASTLIGDSIVAADGSTATLSFSNGSAYSGAMSNVTNANIDASSNWNVTGSSTISKDLGNAGTLAFQNVGDVLTIKGNYTGTSGSIIDIKAALGDDGSNINKLHVLGNTTGTSQLRVTNVGGLGAQTTNGIDVVQVDGSSAANSFTMAAPVQAGSYEYTLQQGSAADANDWYLRSTLNTTLTPTPTPTPATHLYRSAVSLYAMAQEANRAQKQVQMSSLHQRMAEQKGHSAQAQTWGRLIAGGDNNQGQARFDYKQITTGFEFGHDFWSKTSTADQQRLGASIDYAHSTLDGRDALRPLAGLSSATGTIKSSAIGLGGYYTRMNTAGAYLDVVAHVNHLQNDYTDAYSAHSKQSGWQGSVSAEVGKPVVHAGTWQVEPQAQLSYSYSHYNSFSDAYSNIASLNSNDLLARLGVRVSKDVQLNSGRAQYYAIANIKHNFIKPKSITLNDRTSSAVDQVTESFDKTFGEVGVGIQGQVNSKTYLYGDARYQRSFNGNQQGAVFNLGLKLQF